MPRSTKSQADELARLSSDCSFLLTHLIRENQEKEGTSLDILKSILNINNQSATPILNANPVGWYSIANAKVLNPNSQDQFLSPLQTKGVCFTESTLSGLKAHRIVFNSKYGVAFDREFLFKNKNANPCLNIRESLLQKEVSTKVYNRLYNFIPNEIVGFVNVIHESFDATHEREWRVIGELTFNYHEIKFIFCPEEDFKYFSTVQTNGIPVLFDLMWLDRI